MPPDVPATVKANVPDVVTGEPETLIKPPVKVCATLVTVPVPPDAVDAIEIPPAVLVIEMLDPAVSVALVYPLPLPINKAPLAGVVVTPVPPDATGKVPVVSAEVEVAYRAPPLVKLVRPVPPLAVPSVPET